jgi:transposase-like protein
MNLSPAIFLFLAVISSKQLFNYVLRIKVNICQMLDKIQTIKSCPRCGSDKLGSNGWRGLSIRLKCASCGLLFVDDNWGVMDQ